MRAWTVSAPQTDGACAATRGRTAGPLVLPQQGMTLLEITVSSAILSVFTLLALGFMNRTSEGIRDRMNEVYISDKLHNAAVDMASAIREVEDGQITLYRWNESGNVQLERPDGAITSLTQVALCLPTARDTQGRFRLLQQGVIQSTPVWQGIVVYAAYDETLYRYVDRNAHVYSTQNPIRITSINATAIALSDGTTFARSGTPLSSNQTREALLSDLAQLEVPAFTSGCLPPAAAFDLVIRGIDKARESVRSAGRLPATEGLSFTVRARN